MAREKYTAESMIAAIRESKGMMTVAARNLGCNRDTVLNYAKRYSTVAAALKEEREALLDVAEISLYRKIEEGEGWAVCFALKTIGKDRGYVERREHTGKGGEPIEIVEVRAKGDSASSFADASWP